MYEMTLQTKYGAHNSVRICLQIIFYLYYITILTKRTSDKKFKLFRNVLLNNDINWRKQDLNGTFTNITAIKPKTMFELYFQIKEL